MPNHGIRLQAARGQVSLLKADANTAALRCVVNGERSLFPTRTGYHVVAASYRSDPHSLATLERSAVDDEENLAGIAGMIKPLLVNRENGDEIAKGAAAYPTMEDSENVQKSRQPLVAIRSAGEDFLPPLSGARLRWKASSQACLPYAEMRKLECLPNWLLRRSLCECWPWFERRCDMPTECRAPRQPHLWRTTTFDRSRSRVD